MECHLDELMSIPVIASHKYRPLIYSNLCKNYWMGEDGCLEYINNKDINKY